jgi:tRNA pseudouridine55 synthase
MIGALVVDKPPGPTSHDVVAAVRRALGIRRIGHTGTLDPLATGVLVLLLGPATRLAQFLAADEKEYIAHVRLGVESATYDATGVDDVFRLKPEATRDETVQSTTSGTPRLVQPGAESIEHALKRFRGTFRQVPPPFSAKKVEGSRAYQRARRNEPVELRPIEVAVHTLELVNADSSLICLRIVCSSGFYVRSLAHDLGRELGCGAHLEALRRIRAGRFSVDRATPLDVVLADRSATLQRMVPPAELLAHLPAVAVSPEEVERVAHGHAVRVQHRRGDELDANDRVRLVDASGGLLAVARLKHGALHPFVVLV